MVDNLSESHSSDNFNNWDNYQLQINKYLKAIDGNPYVLELCQDFKNISKHKVTKYLENNWKVKFNTLMEQGKITNNDINEINSLFNTDNMMKLFIKSMTDKISIDNELEILKFISLASMKESKENIKNEANKKKVVKSESTPGLLPTPG